MTALEGRILLHLQDGRPIPVDPQEIYLLEAEGGETLVRTRHAQPLTDVRQFSELIDAFESRAGYLFEPSSGWRSRADPQTCDLVIRPVLNQAFPRPIYNQPREPD